VNRPNLGGQAIGADLFEPFVTQGREVYPNPRKSPGFATIGAWRGAFAVVRGVVAARGHPVIAAVLVLVVDLLRFAVAIIAETD
jgi:hypothetical protein